MFSKILSAGLKAIEISVDARRLAKLVLTNFRWWGKLAKMAYVFC